VRIRLVGGILLLGLALCVFIWFGALPSFSAELAAPAAPPTGYDPLTAQEVDRAVAAALNAHQKALQAAAGSEPELLLVERHEVGKGARARGAWPRQGDVYFYDYSSDTLIHTVVDVQSGAVISTERVQGVQLPLTEREEQRALDIVQADAALWSALAERYETITGEPLQRLAQLQVKVSVFQADVMPERLNRAAQACGQHRCAQVLLFTVDKTLLEMLPIVDLSQGRVVQTLGEE
jgi:Cu2+-containing amine oxidase